MQFSLNARLFTGSLFYHDMNRYKTIRCDSQNHGKVLFKLPHHRKIFLDSERKKVVFLSINQGKFSHNATLKGTFPWFKESLMRVYIGFGRFTVLLMDITIAE